VHLKTLCSRWLAENFKIDSNIEHVQVLPQKEIDKALDIRGIEFDFTFGNSECNAVAFFNVEELTSVSHNSEDMFRGIDLDYWRKNSENIEEAIKQSL
jgi:hypothetical protein